jgi:hypothetical protein
VNSTSSPSVATCFTHTTIFICGRPPCDSR